MLDPRSRGALLEALRPPPGYVVDSAIATTYSLDLLAMLTAPLAFSLYDRLAAREGDGPERLDSFALLHAVRRHADRLVVFCQAGCIAKPKGYRQLLAYLEDSLVQVTARSPDGVFHPKVWVTRLTTESGPVRYRVLCLSRNLTFDRSWDTMLALDGELTDRTLAIGTSKPLAEFVEALPSLALAPIRPSQAEIVARIADEIRRVKFEIPAPFEDLAFVPLGHAGRNSDPFKGVRIERMLVLSPFLTDGRLRMLAGRGERHILVSRQEELEARSKETLAAYSDVHVLRDEAEDIDEGAKEDGADDAALGPVPAGRGLHAKLYCAEEGWDAHIWTGSANASDAAFTTNVELLVKLQGKKSKVGIEKILGTDEPGLRLLLSPFRPPAEPIVPTELEEQLAEAMRVANQILSRASWVARVERDSPSSDSKETFTVALSIEQGNLSLPAGCSARAWPITLPAERGRRLDESATARFERCSFHALTAFFAFEVTATQDSSSERSIFVVRVPLVGAPEDRLSRVLHSLLDDPAKVLRFMQMLLSPDSFEALDWVESTELDAGGSRRTADGTGFGAVPLFESLVRTLERQPERLGEVDRLVRELRATPDGTKLLPPDFERAWQPVWDAYQSLIRQRETS